MTCQPFMMVALLSRVNRYSYNGHRQAGLRCQKSPLRPQIGLRMEDIV